MSKKKVTLTRWDDIESDFYTEEEIRESDLRVALMSEIIKARQEKGITQKELEQLSGVSQPVIARMETGKTSPQIDTILKLLAPLGKTLKVVEVE
jgi:DNA-binding XRE family transcriptional regulator